MVKKPSKATDKWPNSAVKAMKHKFSKFVDAADSGSRTSIPHLPPHLDYIFAMPEEPASVKEEMLSGFLTQQGIFQIHLGALLKEYTAYQK